MGKRGPKIIEIDWDIFDKLCGIQCTLAELCAFFGCSEDTVERRVKEHSGLKFADYYTQKRKAGFVSLRRKQFETAMKGNVTMLIWLGKQWLNQVDKPITDETVELESVYTKHEENTDPK